MSMIDAFRFLSKCRTDQEFRKRLYACGETTGLSSFLKDEGYAFVNSEIGDAISSMKLRAVDEYEAEEISELAQWYGMLAKTETPSACASCRPRQSGSPLAGVTRP